MRGSSSAGALTLDDGGVAKIKRCHHRIHRATDDGYVHRAALEIEVHILKARASDVLARLVGHELLLHAVLERAFDVQQRVANFFGQKAAAVKAPPKFVAGIFLNLSVKG